MSRSNGISTTSELLAHAYAIESEAEERYANLADQMAIHNNREVAALFRKLSEIEGKHAEEIRERARDLDLPHLAPWGYQWVLADSPESADLEVAHYLMTPYHALMLALGAEERELKFYDNLARRTPDGPLKRMAREFAREEREHVRLVREWLVKYPTPEEDGDEDADHAGVAKTALPRIRGFADDRKR